MKNPGTFLDSTLAYCLKCNKSEHARIIERNGIVWMERSCPAAGIQSTPLSKTLKWYQNRAYAKEGIPHLSKTSPSKKGCPLDCGVCSRHIGGLNLAVFSITNDCNLNCPKCFTYNRPDKKYYKTPEETRTIIKNILKTNPGIQLINLTGGEPTLHPHLSEILKVCREEGLSRVTMNTNGLKLSQDPSLPETLKKYDVQVVLSMDTLHPSTSVKLYGQDIVKEKFSALEILEKINISTTLLLVSAKGINDQEIPDIISRYITRPFVRSFTIQNMTFTGKNGMHFSPREHLTLEEVESRLCETGFIHSGDFFTPGSAHPLCYSAAYYILINKTIFPLSKILGTDLLRGHTKNRYLIEPDASFSQDFLNGINRLWADGENEDVIRDLKSLFQELHPQNGVLNEKERIKCLEKYTRMIFIHPHMDEDNFDLDRVSRCGDLVPDENGRMIPACSYNLIYRQQDERFWAKK